MFFNAMPAGDLEFFAHGENMCCPGTLVLDPSSFRTDTTRVLGTPGNETLRVAGEMVNSFGRDVERAHLVAYVEGASGIRTDAEVGCGGFIGSGAKAPAAFDIPLRHVPRAPRVVVIGVEAEPLGDLFQFTAHDIVIQHLPRTEDGLEVLGITAMVSNSTTSGMQIYASCATVRDAGGKVIGSASLSPETGLSYLAPGTSVRLRGLSLDMGTSARVDVMSFGGLGQPPAVDRLVP